MIRTLCALALTAAGALALALAGILTKAEAPKAPKPAPRRVTVPRPSPSIISPVGRAIALDVAAYRFVRGGDA